jgi:hypothetical protein
MSKTYQVQGPDGKVHEFEGPDNATPNDVMTAAQAHFSAGAPAAPAAAADGPVSGIDVAGGATAAAEGALDFASFGLDKYPRAALGVVGSYIDGKPATYSEALARVRKQDEERAGTHPVSTAVGDAGGLLAGGGLINAGAKALRAVPGLVGKVATKVDTTLAARSGEPVRNFIRSAAGNGAFAGGVAVVNGESTDQVAINTVTGGLGGAAVGVVANAGLRLFQGASAKGMMALAKALKVKPDELETMYTDYVSQTGGKVPTMAELVALKSERSAGALAQLSARNPIVGEAATRAAATETPSLSDQTIAAMTQKFPQTDKGLVDMRNATMDKNMAPLHAKPVLVNADEIEILKDPALLGALPRRSSLRAKIFEADTQLRDNPDGVATNLTLKDFDTARQVLRKQVSAYANPLSANHNPGLADDFEALHDELMGVATREVPEYAAALNQFKAHSRYITGFRHGQGGKAIGEATEGRLSSALNSDEGQLGYSHGNLLYRGDRQLARIAPSSVSPREEGAHLPHVAQAAGSAAAGWPAAALNHAIRAIPGLHLSDKTQEVVARQLFSRDPVVVRQGIANLRRAGAQDKHIQSMADSIGGAAALNISKELTGK